jgi:CYTH domain-containing protein
VEIERKFVLAAEPPRLQAHEHARIEQGYVALDGNGTEVRVRRRGRQRVLTVKSGSGLVRTEEEWPLEPERFDALWPLTDGRRVIKTRYLVPLDGGLTAEVDVYEGALDGLMTAEVEFGSERESAAFDAPEWLGREVTGDARYANRTLAVSGPP